MGTRLRRVPPDWKHPARPEGPHEQPLHDKSYRADYYRKHLQRLYWERGLHPDQSRYPDTNSTWEDWDGVLGDPEYYRPDWSREEATAYQFYETVTEGTPVSPVLANEAEVRRYIEESDFAKFENWTPMPGTPEFLYGLSEEEFLTWIRSLSSEEKEGIADDLVRYCPEYLLLQMEPRDLDTFLRTTDRSFHREVYSLLAAFKERDEVEAELQDFLRENPPAPCPHPMPDSVLKARDRKTKTQKLRSR